MWRRGGRREGGKEGENENIQRSASFGDIQCTDPYPWPSRACKGVHLKSQRGERGRGDIFKNEEGLNPASLTVLLSSSNLQAKQPLDNYRTLRPTQSRTD